MINVYNHAITAEKLHDYLLGDVKVGDADELHNVLIVLCDIVNRQQAQIVHLNQSVQRLYTIVSTGGDE